MTTTPDLRAALERLLHDLIEGKMLDGAIVGAQAALATPPPEPPTDDELNALWNCCGNHDEEGDHYGNIFQFARAAIERWGAK
jgi:hypothetical protein